MNRPLAILDIETDPFEFGRVPKPFAVGIYTAESWRVFWGPDCISESIAYLAAWGQEYIICAHNGGKFDYMYYLPYITGKLKIINGRIVSARMAGHEIRDSYAILPFPLRNYKKDEIDYRKFEAPVRDFHRAEICEYLKGDCVYLYELVNRFHETHGQKYITVGSAALAQIKKHHEVIKTDLAFDRVFRPEFFYGGRVQCFKTGVLSGTFEIYDVNSMYPDGMRNGSHPTGADYIVGDQINDATCFIISSGFSYGAFPRRTESGGLEFPTGRGIFSVTRHEYDAAISTGTFLPTATIRAFDFSVRDSFTTAVDYFFDARRMAKASGDEAGAIGWKFVSNSGYGKFAQNPANFHDWTIAPLKSRPREQCPHCRGRGTCARRYQGDRGGCYQCRALNDYAETDGVCMFCQGSGQRWHLHEMDAFNPTGPMVWKARTFVQSYNNVATGSSITGWGRGKLLRGLADSTDPVYCDTDSVICSAFRGDVGPGLGQWKHEGTGSVAAIAGKKLYCIFADRRPDMSREAERKYPWMLKPVQHNGRKLWPIKKAHKGFNLSPAEILHVAQGWEIEKPNPAPTFGVFKEPCFISRVARRTGKAEPFGAPVYPS